MILRHHTRPLRAVTMLGVVLLIILPRVFDLDRFLTADEKRWVANTSNFVTHLAYSEWDKLLQQPHPGLTTQWFGGATVFSQSWTIRKLPLVLWSSVLIVLIGYVFARLWGWKTGALLALLLALNPLLIAHTRVYAMDAFLALFLLLSVGLLFLWRKTQLQSYLLLAALTASLCWLSKLPGVIIIPFTVALLIYWQWRNGWSWRVFARHIGVWSLVFLATSCVVLPPLFLSPLTTIQNLIDFFYSDDYRELHQAKDYFYLSTLFFFSTPLEILGLCLLPLAWMRASQRRVTREELASLLFLAVAFIALMSLGAKKGDRYILPSFLLLDAVVAAVGALLLSSRSSLGASRTRILTSIFSLLIAGQLFWVWQLHPYYLAYVNPLTKPFFGQHRLGWGEGLDLAAEYLNQKPEAAQLKVASYYPVEFGYRFLGTAVALHEYEDPTVDYYVAYRAMYERGGDAWETDVLTNLRHQQPEKVITLNGLEYVWIYAAPRSATQ